MPEVLNLNYVPDGRVTNETGHDPAIARVTGFQRYFLGADPGHAMTSHLLW